MTSAPGTPRPSIVLWFSACAVLLTSLGALVDRWALALGIVYALMCASIWMSYYVRGFGRDSQIWTRRYRMVGSADNVGPVLELGFALLLTLSVLFVCRLIFPRVAEDIEREPLWLILCSIAIAIGTCMYCMMGGVSYTRSMFAFRTAPSDTHKGDEATHDPQPSEEQATAEPAARVADAEDEQWSPENRNEPRVVWELPDDIRERVREMRAEFGSNTAVRDAEINRVRRAYMPYTVFSVGVFTMALIYVVVIAWGVFGYDAVRIASARENLDEATPKLATIDAPEAIAAVRAYSIAFTTFREVMIDVAKHLTAILASAFVLLFWLVGTSYQVIYAPSVIAIARWTAFILLCAILPAAIFGCYVLLAVTGNDVSSRTRELVERAETPERVERLQQLHLEVDQNATVEDFWGRLTTSSGGIVLIVALGLSLWQKRKQPWSFLSAMVPDGLRRRFRKRGFFGAIFAPARPRQEPGATGETQIREVPR